MATTLIRTIGFRYFSHGELLALTLKDHFQIFRILGVVSANRWLKYKTGLQSPARKRRQIGFNTPGNYSRRLMRELDNNKKILSDLIVRVAQSALYIN